MNIAALDTPADPPCKTLAADLDVLESGTSTVWRHTAISSVFHYAFTPKRIKCQKSLNYKSPPVLKASPAKNQESFQKLGEAEVMVDAGN